MSKETERLGDGPIEERYRQQMNGLAAAIDELFNGSESAPHAQGKPDQRKVGFVLLVYEFGDEPGRCNFISNGADRKDIVTLFKEMIARFEGQPEVSGHA
ncbi:MAG: hypothetical protein J2P55_00670 [Rhizobiales bacterium]|nr:hypothetical protein [Hyphomicrobiales bacterium]